MIKIEKSDVYGWEAAIRGMRNPMNSWHLSDSDWCIGKIDECGKTIGCDNSYCIGEKDLKLMQNLSRAGNDHGKFLRYINVTVDIIAPLYWWKEFDTYKVGTVANSCSTMHKIQAKEFTIDDFSCEHLKPTVIDGGIHSGCLGTLEKVVDVLNHMRVQYLTTKNKFYWWQMIQLLPTSYNQKRTVMLNYQVLKSMYFARKEHKLDEWHDFCDWCKGLPYFKEICLEVAE